MIKIEIKKRKRGKKGQMHFAWIFAIIVGAIILFLTFFFLGRQLFFQEEVKETVTAHGLDILLGPFSYLGAVTEASSDEIILRETQIIDFECREQGLGNNIIIINYQTTHNIYDKYIFAREMNTNNLSLISKPFEMPFRVADLIFLASGEKKYCFVKAPSIIENELVNLDTGFEFQNNPGACEQGAVKICFDVSSYCEIKIYNKGVNYDCGEVATGSEKVYFCDRALLYGAIFSSKQVYECNVKRLITRMDPLISIYRDKARYLSTIGCKENYYSYLASLDNAVVNFNVKNLDSFKILYDSAQELENLNEWASCPLY